jgi:hypothetical protein
MVERDGEGRPGTRGTELEGAVQLAHEIGHELQAE